mmetsp:Transcript_45312/g.109711  ORF Transcript_45312/g.109711 Transcript_45312/m.109711 type:complete len:86 (+) Transcript_45312:720-977(+)
MKEPDKNSYLPPHPAHNKTFPQVSQVPRDSAKRCGLSYFKYPTGDSDGNPIFALMSVNVVRKSCLKVECEDDTTKQSALRPSEGN